MIFTTIVDVCIILVMLVGIRVTDGIEQGLHWYSRPSRDTGDTFHQADLVQTFMVRGLYAYSLVALLGAGWGTLVALIGVSMVDQSVWQMFLNWFAAGHPLRGELDDASFLLWPTSKKVFRNRARLLQFVIGAWLALLGFLM